MRLTKEQKQTAGVLYRELLQLQRVDEMRARADTINRMRRERGLTALTMFELGNLIRK